MSIVYTNVNMWDEFFSNNRKLFEAAYEATDGFQNMRLVNPNDCHQIGPIIQNGTRQDIVNAGVITSDLWYNFKN